MKNKIKELETELFKKIADIEAATANELAGLAIKYKAKIKEVRKQEKLPLSVQEIPSKGVITYCINKTGIDFINTAYYPLHSSYLVNKKSTAEAFLALIQLVRLRDAWNKGWMPDWENTGETKHCIRFAAGDSNKTTQYREQTVLAFKEEKIRDLFLEQFKDLIETAKELL